jgi:hypothetical protein
MNADERGLRRVGLVLVAAAAAFVPLPHAFIERWYSTGLYVHVQSSVTRGSNLTPFAWFDVLIVVTLGAWLFLAIADVRRGRKIAVRTITWTAALYLAFLLLWGLNYRRTKLTNKLQFDSQAVSPEAALELANTAVDRLNELHDRGTPVEGSLADAFDRVQRELGAAKTAIPARPKRTLLNPLFRMAEVAGMTDPYFLETLIQDDLLPFERPMVVAHEWGHLAGYADESEASFAGWLTCVHGSISDQYSGWLFMFEELAAVVRTRDRPDLFRRLASGPLADLRAIGERRQRQANRVVSFASSRLYDGYLRANHVESGVASYDEVVRLALGVRFGADWVPTLAPRH